MTRRRRRRAKAYAAMKFTETICALLFVITRTREKDPFSKFAQTNRLACSWLWIAWLALAATLWMHGRKSSSDIVYTSRNFYGVLKVFEHRKNEPTGHHFLLQHGRITHGLQFADRQQAAWPTEDYHLARSLVDTELPEDDLLAGIQEKVCL